MFLTAFLASGFLIAAEYPTDLPADDTEFAYYFGDFLTHALADNHPMARLIVDRSVDALFEADSQKTLNARLERLKYSARKYPELIKRFVILDEKLKKAFSRKLTEAKQKRLIYSTAGAVIGALVAIPIGRLIATHSSLGNKVFWIAVPSGVLAGAGVGFLWNELLKMPEPSESEDFLSRDLSAIQNEMNN